MARKPRFCGLAAYPCWCMSVSSARTSGFVATAEETEPIRRPIRTEKPVSKDGPRINEDIRVREVQLIDKDGANKGVTEINAAIAMAQEAGLDLVEIAPNSVP